LVEFFVELSIGKVSFRVSDDTMLKKTVEEFGFAIVPAVIEAENLQVTRRC
jgi:hypothetical protein